MTTKIIKLLTCIALATTIIACTSKPILNINNTRIPATSTSNIQQIEKVIMRAGQKRKWQMTKIEPGKIQGIHRKNQHMAKIYVHYTNTNYSIHYAGSKNLNHSNGKIHRNYNRWINNLHHDIQQMLKMVR